MNNISIIKARKIDKQITIIIQYPIKSNFKLSKFKNIDNINPEILKNKDQFDQDLANMIKLITLKYKLRLKIQKSNSTNIDELLSKKHKLLAILDCITQIQTTSEDLFESEMYNFEIIKGKFSKRDNDGYYNSDSIIYTVIDKQTHDRFVNQRIELLNDISNIDEDMMMSNFSKSIELSDEDLEILNYFKIII